MSDQLFQYDTETAILSILLKNPEKVYEVQDIKDFMFSSTTNQLLFNTINSLSAQGLTPEINLIFEHLKSKNKDVLVGGKDYLNSLMSYDYNAENLREFERLLIDSHKAKTLISLAGSIPAQVTGSKDIDTIIGNVRNTLDNLTEYSSGDSTSNLADVLKLSWAEIVERTKNPGIRGATTGSRAMDLATTGISGGELWTVAGRPGMGKTALECNMALHQAKASVPTLIFSLEMRKTPLVERMVAIETGVFATNMRLGMLSQEELDKISNTMTKIQNLPIHIDSNYNANLPYVLSTIRKYQKMHGVKIVYLDYIQLLSERSADATNEIGRLTRALKLLANELDIGIVILSQLSRNCEYREDKRPILSDLRQSGNIEEDSDVVISLYRDEVYNKETTHKGVLEQIVLKQRSGPIGTVLTTFDGNTNRINDK
jgi:replicative DNA helicase